MGSGNSKDHGPKATVVNIKDLRDEYVPREGYAQPTPAPRITSAPPPVQAQPPEIVVDVVDETEVANEPVVGLGEAPVIKESGLMDEIDVQEEESGRESHSSDEGELEGEEPVIYMDDLEPRERSDSGQETKDSIAPGV